MKKIKLKDISNLSKGKQINGTDLLDNGIYPFLNGGINPSGRWNEYNVDENTIAISEGGNSCGFVNFMSEKFWCGAHCYYLFNVKGNIKYLYYALKRNEKQIQKLRSGACMPNIKKDTLLSFELNYDENEKNQEKIVLILDSIQNIIKNRKEQICKLNELVKSQFVEHNVYNQLEVA